MDLASRRLKGLKIERLLNLKQFSEKLTLLEIGTGSGGISSYFGTHPTLDILVDSVDIEDLRVSTEGYTFTKVSGVELPFESNSFDIVISNHVIEHVGNTNNQIKHLNEIKRVMKSSGRSYLAVPNRWMVVEPHYQVAFLSWLPHSFRSRYLKLKKGIEFYDCEPLEMTEAENLFSLAGLDYENLSVDAIYETFDIEQPGKFVTALIKSIPRTFYNTLKNFIPTLIYRLDVRDED